MAQATRFNRWMAEKITPFLGREVLEIGAGIGNLTALLSEGRVRYLATDPDETQLRELQARLGDRPEVQTALCDAAEAQNFSALKNCFDTVVCLNVLEHISDDDQALANIYSALRAQGRAVVLVPQGAAAFGSLDEVLLHKKRYSARELRTKLTQAGFHLETILPFNRATYPGWILNSKVLRRRTLSTPQLRLFDLTVPLWRRVDRFLPWPPTSLIAVGVKGRR